MDCEPLAFRQQMALAGAPHLVTSTLLPIVGGRWWSRGVGPYVWDKGWRACGNLLAARAFSTRNVSSGFSVAADNALVGSPD